MSNKQKKESQNPEFNLDHLAKKNGSFPKLTRDEQAMFDGKCAYFGAMTLTDFKQGKARPRIWGGDYPATAPSSLSEDVTDVLFRINFTDKMRVFAFRLDNVFFVLCIDAKHKSG